MTFAAIVSPEVTPVNIVTKNGNHILKFGSGSDAPTLSGVIRVSSLIVASESPFVVQVLNAAGSWTTYKIQGQKPTKITLPRDSSMAGNPALFNQAGNVGLLRIRDNDNNVDINVNCVVDGTLDD